MSPETASWWASNLGLLEVPLFGSDSSSHRVLLNGNRGSFVLSLLSDAKADLDEAANWIWSADVPHHIWLGSDRVTLSRWDDPVATRSFSRASVETKLDAFYEYLLLDRITTRLDVIDHCISIFRRARSVLSASRAGDEWSIHYFLLLIAALLEGNDSLRGGELEDLVRRYQIDPEVVGVLGRLGEGLSEGLIGALREGVGRRLRLDPAIMMRHAAGAVFQEAHFELIRGGPAGLFHVPAEADVASVTRGGTYFTPPALARALVERTLGSVKSKNRLTIFDPACGAGSFLHEALRYFGRSSDPPRMHLVGFDASAAAAAMARFTLSRALSESRISDRVDLSIQVADSLSEDVIWPRADAILMNPPFLAWANADSVQRQTIRRILGKWYLGRPDYSMAFVERAVSTLGDGGVLGTLVPSGVLSTEAALKWRRHLLDAVTPRFVGLFGDHSMFRHATVEVGCLVLRKEPPRPNARLLALWSSSHQGSASEALRAMRRSATEVLTETSATSSPTDEATWKMSTVAVSELERAVDWRPKPAWLGPILSEIQTMIGTRVENLFGVRQGVRAGLREAFILSAKEYRKLPKDERRFFRPVAENRNIRDGRLLPGDFIFYPDTGGLPSLISTKGLVEHLPVFQRRLSAYQARLTRRASMADKQWWSLTRPRGYLAKPEPKIVSSYFGDAGSFAVDQIGDSIVVQGFAWILKGGPAEQMRKRTGDWEAAKLDLLFAYASLINSRPFSLLLQEFCPHVAGGQLNLSRRFVAPIPLPNLADELLSAEHSPFVRTLIDAGRAAAAGETRSGVDSAAAELYRVPFERWPTVHEG